MGLSLAQRPAAIDDFLRAALDFRIATLHGGEVEIGRGLAAAHRRSRAAAQADEHGRPAQHHQMRTHGHIALLHLLRGGYCPGRRQS